MAGRYCVECGSPVRTTFCPRCGALQPEAPSPEASRAAGWHPAAQDEQTGRLLASGITADDDPAFPITADWVSPGPTAGAESARTTSEQPWHPFEQPTWYSDDADPRAAPTREIGPDFMGVGLWQTEEPPPPPHQRRKWLLGVVAGVVVFALLALVAFLVIRNQGSEDASPGQGSTTAAASTTGAPAGPTTVTVTATDSNLPPVAPSEPAAPSTTSTTSAADDPRGGPAEDIACTPGFIVQIASAGDEAGFVARVAELRAAGQLPAGVKVANTSSSCQIFRVQTNSIVLYAGPFTDVYAGCEARLAGAPDSFIKGATPETAAQYVSCLCPAQVVTVPAISAIDQADVWVGELQRILVNRLSYAIDNLAASWGVFTQSTSDAVKRFQSDAGVPATGLVDAATWQALQTAEC